MEIKSNPESRTQQPTQLEQSPNIFILDQRISDIQSLKESFSTFFSKQLISLFIKEFDKKIEESPDLDFSRFLLDFFKSSLDKKQIIITFDGSLDENGRSFCSNFSLNSYDLFNQFFLEICRNSSKIKEYLKSINLISVQNLLSENLENKEIEFQLYNFDHHPFPEGKNAVDNFFERFKILSSAQGLFENFTNWIEKLNQRLLIEKHTDTNESNISLKDAVAELQITGIHEPLNASDPDSLICLVLIKIFQQNPEIFLDSVLNQRLKLIIDLVGLYDIWAGFPPFVAIEDFMQDNKEVIDSLCINFENLESYIKTDLLPLIYNTLDYQNKPKTNQELENIITKSVKSISVFINAKPQEIGNLNNKNLPSQAVKPLNESGVEVFESQDLSVSILEDCREIPPTQIYGRGKIVIYLIYKGSGIFSLFSYPPFNTTKEIKDGQKETLEAQIKEAIKLKNYLNLAMNYAMQSIEKKEAKSNEEIYKEAEKNNTEEELESPISPGCICGNRKNPFVMYEGFDCKSFIQDALSFYFKEN